MNKDQIQQHYLSKHNALGTRKKARNKELFDQRHRQIWADCDTELKARKAELEALPSLNAEQAQELKELRELIRTDNQPEFAE